MEKLKINNLESKLNSWNKKRLQVDAIVDAVGTSIDEGIKDTVVALQVSGVQTTSSHEGKLYRYPIPYVDIESYEAAALLDDYSSECEQLISPEERDLRNERSTLLKQWRSIDDPADPEYIAINDHLEEIVDKLNTFPDVSSETSEKIKEQLLKTNRVVEDKINQLLESFYANRIKNEECELVLKPMGIFGAMRLLPKSYKQQEGELNERVAAERLKRYQTEMRAFTDYLKQQYLDQK